MTTRIHRGPNSLLPEEAFMYVFFLPSIVALCVICSITLRDQFRFSTNR